MLKNRSFVVCLNIVRIFANNIQGMEEKKDYTATQEQLARFAKALGHPARIAIMYFWQSRKRVILGIFTKNFPLPKQPYRNTLKS